MAGPTITLTTTTPVDDQGQTWVLAVAKPASGQKLQGLRQFGGTSKITLGPVQADGSAQVIYMAPASVTSGTYDKIDYAVYDQDGSYTRINYTSVELDAGVVLTATVPSPPPVMEQGQSTVIGTVKPGLSSDGLTITQTAGAGVLSLSTTAQADGSRQVIYTAPRSISASGTDTVTYTVSDAHNGSTGGSTSAKGSASVQLNSGPGITAVAPSVVEVGQTTR